MKIIQKTPLIDFEAQQKSGFLRASELKPRITKFIKNEFLSYYDGDKKEEFKKLINNKTIFPENKGSGYFKLHIQKSQIIDIYEYKTFISRRDRGNPSIKIGSYFGDYPAIKIGKTEIKVISYIKSLKELVEEAFKYFFVLYNIGARQTKGFGGFIVEGTTKEEFEKILKKKYKTIFKKNSEKKEPLEIILEDYQLLKSGTNRPYKKSLLFQYFASKNIGWEKRVIKEAISQKCPNNNILNLNKHMPNSEFNDYKYIRAMLGVASSISFKKDRGMFVVNVSNQQIDKFASPILFKVYGDTIYALPNKIPSKMFNQKFVFKSKFCRDLRENIYTPNNFNLEEFLDKYLTKLKWSRL